jgi:hypothetical protein
MQDLIMIKKEVLYMIKKEALGYNKLWEWRKVKTHQFDSANLFWPSSAFAFAQSAAAAAEASKKAQQSLTSMHAHLSCSPSFRFYDLGSEKTNPQLSEKYCCRAKCWEWVELVTLTATQTVKNPPHLSLYKGCVDFVTHPIYCTNCFPFHFRNMKNETI